MAHFGPALGKGDAMWRGLAATSGDIVAYLDTDTEDFHAGFVTGLLGPLLTDDTVAFVKGAFRRPMRVGATVVPDGGGRVTELVARPFLNLHVPELAGFLQPLAGEVAARRELLERLPFPVGYGVEIAMLIDALREVGLDRMAQVRARLAPEPPPAAARPERDGAGRARHRRAARPRPRLRRRQRARPAARALRRRVRGPLGRRRRAPAAGAPSPRGCG